MADNEQRKETVPYKCYKRYRDTFYNKSNLDEVLKENRDFYSGRQYSDMPSNMPKPTFNICREGVEKIMAKILETKSAIQFIADMDTENLQTLDNFYEYQMKEIDDDEITAMVCKMGLIDGMGVSITAYDDDTIGSNSQFRGFLKREVIPFENTYWENPYTSDEQDQQYWGYVMPMEVSAVKAICEGDRSDEELNRLLAPEYEQLSTTNSEKLASDIDGNVINVYTRFFRLDGEVYFELATQFCDIYEHPHALNPRLNEEKIKKAKEEYLKSLEKEEEQSQDKEIRDYIFDPSKYTLFTKAKKSNDKELKKSKSKFYRYPVSIYKPYPQHGSIVGESFVSQIVANQKIINYIFLMIILIMQNHAMPKILTKPDALRNQVYDTSPNQILVDYTPIQSGVQWGITRLQSGDAVNSNLIEIGNNVLKLTRNINGFDDLTASVTADTSGYAYQQMVQQANVTIQQPQKRLWRYLKNNARTDILYFKHYIPSAKYYIRLDDASYELNENYRQMAQGVIDSGSVPSLNKEILPQTQRVQVKDIGEEMFDSDFNVTIDVEQGIASSQLSESQHYQNVFQYIASGNLDADKIRLMVENDPAFSAKTRSRVLKSLEALENSQLQVKNDEITQLKQMCEQLVAQLNQSKQQIDYLGARDKARNQAFKQSIDENKAAVEAFANQPQQGLMTESEVKSQNAKGKSGGSFSPSND